MKNPFRSFLSGFERELPRIPEHESFFESWIPKHTSLKFAGTVSRDEERVYYPRDPDEGTGPQYYRSTVNALVFERDGKKLFLENRFPAKLRSEDLAEADRDVKFLIRKLDREMKTFSENVDLPHRFPYVLPELGFGVTKESSQENWSFQGTADDLIHFRFGSYRASGGYTPIWIEVTAPAEFSMSDPRVELIKIWLRKIYST